MNGRTCQLCGKALSRFTVGSGGDFCSREHRNQFRLRLGMDRLVEANKVASLMRRRENAKTIPASQLVRDTAVSPRLAPIVRMPVHQLDLEPLRPLDAALSKPAVAIQTTHPRLSSQLAQQMHAEARSMERQGFQARQRPILPPRTEGFEARMAAAGAVLPRLDGARVAQIKREVMEFRLNTRRTHFGGNGIQVRSLHAPPQHCQEPQPARRLNNSADRGRDLRVSGGIGFRLSTPRVRSIEFARPRTNPPARSTAPRSLAGRSQAKKSSSVAAGVVRFTVRIPSAPPGPRQNNRAEFQWPDTPFSGTEPARDNAVAARICDLNWLAPPPLPPRLRHRDNVARLSCAQPPELSLPTPQACTIASQRRPTVVSFQPQEAPFQCPSDLHGTLSSILPFGAAPPRKVEAAPATLEEHFDSGLKHWVGKTDDWKVDVAGVRPGSLALYSPSLEIPNYLLEFLTRVELRGITWVFRASNLADYYQATLAVAPAGGYEFRRHASIGGLAETAIVKLVPPTAPPNAGKTAVTVRLRAAGNEFTVSLDGQVIDTWTDSRLSAGGIGFVGAPEERARLYWVRVTPIGHSSKEFSKR